MKKVCLLTVRVLSVVLGFNQSQLQKCEDGTYRVKPKEGHNVGVVVTKEAEEYIDDVDVSKLIADSGHITPVGVERKEFIKMVSLFKMKIVKTSSNGLFYKNKIIGCTGMYLVSTEIKTSNFVIFAMISVVLVILSNFFFVEFNNTETRGITSLTSFIALFLGVFNVISSIADGIFPFLLIIIFATFCVAAVFVSAILSEDEKKRTVRFWTSSSIFYLLMIIFFALIYT